MKKLILAINLLGFCLLFGQSALAGSVVIKNENCTMIGCGFLKLGTCDSVEVHIYAPDEDCRAPGVQSVCSSKSEGFPTCTTGTWTIDNGSSGRIELVELGINATQICAYAHEAAGTAGGKQDVDGNEDSSVTCSKDWAGVCQCTKD
jgi:hypothetical protein